MFHSAATPQGEENQAQWFNLLQLVGKILRVQLTYCLVVIKQELPLLGVNIYEYDFWFQGLSVGQGYKM